MLAMGFSKFPTKLVRLHVNDGKSVSIAGREDDIAVGMNIKAIHMSPFQATSRRMNGVLDRIKQLPGFDAPNFFAVRVHLNKIITQQPW